MIILANACLFNKYVLSRIFSIIWLQKRGDTLLVGLDIVELCRQGVVSVGAAHALPAQAVPGGFAEHRQELVNSLTLGETLNFFFNKTRIK